MTTFRKLVSSIAGAVILGLTLLLATPAQALPGQTTPVTSQTAPIVALTGLTPSCSGDNCSGKDPMATNCAEGAYTMTNASLEDVQIVYTPMIYSPVRKVRAEIVNICGSAGLIGAAFDCLTNGIESTRSF